MKNIVTWFEIPVTDMQRAKDFYSAILETGFQDNNMDGFKMAIFDHEDPAVSGMLVEAEGYEPSKTGAVIYLNGGDDLSAPLDRAIQNGAEILVPKTAIECGHFAQFSDSEGNRVGLYSIG
jgi:predicted enzyme related to lactoylglutathione lyase